LQHKKSNRRSFVMKTVTQKARRRQAIIKYAEKYGVTKAANHMRK